MSRSEEFEGGALYHGTGHEVAPGDSIMPGATYGKSSFRHVGPGPRGVAHSKSAFATTKESEAWHFANTAATKHGGRARVYEVEPHPEMQPGLYNPAHPTYKRRTSSHGGVSWAEWASPSFKPTGRTVDTMPGHQGTFPQLNWKQFAKADGSAFRDHVNHPDPKDVQDGHPWSQMRKDHDDVDWAEAEAGHGPYGADYKKPPPPELPGQMRLL